MSFWASLKSMSTFRHIHSRKKSIKRKAQETHSFFLSFSSPFYYEITHITSNRFQTTCSLCQSLLLDQTTITSQDYCSTWVAVSPPPLYSKVLSGHSSNQLHLSERIPPSLMESSLASTFKYYNSDPNSPHFSSLVRVI